MSELKENFLKSVKMAHKQTTGENNAFDLAFKLTKEYSSSANANAEMIPGLFINLFRLFEEGKNQKLQEIS